MPLSAAERQRKYREKLKATNPDKFKEQKKKNSERTLRRYKNKSAQYSEDQKEQLRLKWRKDRKMKENVKKIETINLFDIKIQNLQRRLEYKFKKENIELRRKIIFITQRYINIQKKVLRQQKIMNDMKKNVEYLLIKHEDRTEEGNSTELTPVKRISEFIDTAIPDVETPKKKEIKRKLIEHDLLKESFKAEYKKSSNAEKNTLRRLVNSEILKKYKQTTNMRASLGLKICNYKKRREYQKKRYELQEMIASFYKRDDVSRASAGKKEYRTHNKVKYQKRYLLDKLQSLHKKFIAEVARVSFSTFKKYRPFFILPPRITDRDSCACIKHSNMQFIADKLKSFDLLQSNNLNDVVSDLVCDFKAKKCMYGECTECSDRRIGNGDEDLETKVSWFKWALKEYIYGKEDNLKKSKKMMKIIKEGTVKELIETFNREINSFKRHVFNFYYQYDQYKFCQSNLKECEAIIHIDFSENYACKYYQEVQAKHFVKDQITLHTGVLYLKGQRPISFCSISPDNQHGPEAIWAHLDPVLNYIKTTYLNISIIHFFSDGPTTQYRQKKNFYLFSQNIYNYGFSHGTWSFFEAAHGKGAADGIGGAIKRILDMKTAQGLDIPDAQAAYNALLSTDTIVKIFYVPAETIKTLDSSITKNLTPLPGTMKIHQLITCGPYKLKYRDLSCFCKNDSGNCECHFPVYFDFTKGKGSKTQSQHDLKRKYIIEKTDHTNENPPKKIPRRFEKSDSSSESESDTHIEYAESDISDDLSDVSANNDLDLFSNENKNDCYLDEKSGNFQKQIDSGKKINVLSTVIVRKPLKKSSDLESEASIHKDLICPSKVTDDNTRQVQDWNMKEILKVTPLSEIRYSEENKAHLNIRMCKILFEEKRNINITNKENNAGPTTSNTGNRVWTTGSTDYKFLMESPIHADLQKTEANENQKTETYEDLRMKIIEKTSEINKVEEHTTNIQNDCRMITASKEDFDQDLMNLDDNASVLVRYYQRKQWKYYIGFVMQAVDKDNELFYKIRFLKTVKSAKLIFLMTKKSEVDIVPINLIVKRINLIPQGEAKEYFLKDDFDYVYFS